MEINKNNYSNIKKKLASTTSKWKTKESLLSDH